MSHNNHPHHDCIAMFEKLSAYIDKELDEITCKDIEKHAENCVACQACIATLKQTVALCKKMAVPPPPKDFSQRIKTMIRNLKADRTEADR